MISKLILKFTKTILISLFLQFFLINILNADSLLMDACRVNDLRVVQQQIEAGADLNEESLSGYTPLMIASLHGHSEVVRQLIKAGADLNEKSLSGYTPLMIASQNGHSEVVRQLIEAGADLNEKSFCYTALVLASGDGHDEVVKQLVEAGAEMSTEELGEAFVRAVKGNNPDAVEKLIKAGANVNTLIPYTLTTGDCDWRVEHTVLIYAIRNGRSNMVKLLLKVAKKQLESQFDEALLLAIEEGPRDVVEEFIKAGARRLYKFS